MFLWTFMTFLWLLCAAFVLGFGWAAGTFVFGAIVSGRSKQG